MYRVVVIDDEWWTLQGILKTFAFSKKGFEVVFTTTNSKKALSYILHNNIDVILTDIKMPGISGLDLLKKVRENDKDVEFIIISGYAEFDYAREALREGVFDYCLKPIKKEKADEVLSKLKLKIKDKNKASYTVEKTTKNNDKLRKIDNQDFKDLLGYLHNNYTEKLYLKDLSRRFGFNANYTCHLFNKYTGRTFSEYLTDLRMKKAADLLQKKLLTIKAIASQTGYNDYYYFNKVFKKYYGITASAYRKQKLNG